MKIAYLDTVSGIAGDMTMAAFVSAGLRMEDLAAELRKLPITGFELVGSHVRRSAIDAVHIDVVVAEQPDRHRHLADILAIIDAAPYPAPVKERAKQIFTVIAEAEARLHNTPVDRVHFHEVGAIDSIVDIVGTCLCLELLGIEQVYSSPVKLGSGGLVQTQHGPMPAPTPATLEILRGYPTVLTSIPRELTTPTGAAIVKSLSRGVLAEETITVEAVGYGAGTLEFPEIPNFLRVIIGDLPPDLDRDRIVVVETNIDDMNPQVYPFLIEQLLAAGAHDAYLVPIIMKKGRPGILLSVMAARRKLDDVIEIIYRQTSTIGLRVQQIDRRKLPRREAEVKTSFGPVRVKFVEREGREIMTPEFEECKRIALEQKIPLLDVMRRIEKELSGT